MDNSYLHKKLNFDWNKNVAENILATNDPVIWFFFQYSLVLIPNPKGLAGGSQIRCGESGTPSTIIYQLGAAANFDDLVKFGDCRQIRRSQMFIKLAFEFGCDVIFMSHPITRSLGSKLR